MTLTSGLGQGLADVAAPGRYVPGAVLPLVVQELAERPSLVRTESFVGVETLAPAGLLSLFVARLNDSPERLDEDEQPVECAAGGVDRRRIAARGRYAPDYQLRGLEFS